MGSITSPTPQMMRLVREWEAEFPTAVFAGINGDAAHQTAPGKHLSRSQNRDKFGSRSWPIQHSNDKRGPLDKACAVDMRMALVDLRRAHTNLIKVFNNRRVDPRARFIYAFNGWDGNGSPGRYNLVNGTVAITDDSHTWHEHGEGFYAFVNDPQMVDAWMSGLRGETISEYLGVDEVELQELMEAPVILRQDGPDSNVAYPVKWSSDRTTFKGGLESLLYYMLQTRNIGLASVAKLNAMTVVVQALGDAIRAGGGSVDTTAILSGVDERLAAFQQRIEDDTRDAIGDALEGGSPAVRADN